MFVRRKRNNSGTISVQIIEKTSKKYKVLKTIGCSSDNKEIEKMFLEGQKWILSNIGQTTLDFFNEKEIFSNFINGIQQITIAGVELLLGKIFDEIGFNKINDLLFRQLVLSRISFPVSKLKTSDYLRRYHLIDINEDAIYRYLDKLDNSQKQIIQTISYQHTLKIMNNNISIVFYDVTTLYFECDLEDEIRRRGFSKEGKHQNPQIVLGLLVSIDGYPLAYEIFEGNKFEGHTILPVINRFREVYKINKLVIISDAGLMSNENIVNLQTNGYEFILGARIKNENKTIKEQILALKLKNGESAIIKKDSQINLIISYTNARATKDKFNRQKGLNKLEKQITTGKLTKTNINKRGYNKYLKLEGEIKVSIDRNKFEEDSCWDGLKGYLTNTKLSKKEVIENYQHLWNIEKAFRITKSDLKIRPVYHRLERRIQAHICISFVAYKIYKELERQLKNKKTSLTPEKAIDIAKTIYSIKILTPLNKELIQQTLILNKEQKYLAELFEF
jgi:transposase